MQYKIIVDKQPSSNPSDEKKEYIIDIEELRVKGDVYDSLNIEKDRTYVTRRLSLSEYGVLSVLDEPIIQELTDLNIELFEGDNYIYLMDMQGNKFYAEYLIKNDFNDIYATKNEMNSAITQSAQSIELSVNQKLTSYATNEDLEEQVTELNSTITQTASEINAEVEKKVDEETITGAYLILKINGDTSEAKLNADKIELSANDILNLLAGNTINLTSENIVISSTNFNVDKDGNVEANNATVNNIDINNGMIYLESEKSISTITLTSNNGKTIYLSPLGISILGNDGSPSPGNAIYINTDNNNEPVITVLDSSMNQSTIEGKLITTPKLTQTSLERIKKNINKFTKNATDIINNSDIYEYNLKSDKDEDKKLIGFVIGDNYKTPSEVISKEGQGIELYSTIGILWKGFQEREEIIKQLKEENNRKDKILAELILRVEQLEKEVQHG